jgi:hypothetical protein
MRGKANAEIAPFASEAALLDVRFTPTAAFAFSSGSLGGSIATYDRSRLVAHLVMENYIFTICSFMFNYSFIDQLRVTIAIGASKMITVVLQLIIVIRFFVLGITVIFIVRVFTDTYNYKKKTI